MSGKLTIDEVDELRELTETQGCPKRYFELFNRSVFFGYEGAPEPQRFVGLVDRFSTLPDRQVKDINKVWEF